MKWRATAETAIRPWIRPIDGRSSRDPIWYAGEKPPKAWNVATLTLFESWRTTSDRNGTNGSWKWSRSNCSRSRTSRTCERKRGDTVIVPTEPFAGIEKPRPIRMTSPSEARWRPWLLLMIRTS